MAAYRYIALQSWNQRENLDMLEVVGGWCTQRWALILRVHAKEGIGHFRSVNRSPTLLVAVRFDPEALDVALLTMMCLGYCGAKWGIERLKRDERRIAI